MNSPRISVVITAYDHAEFIDEAIRSVLRQTLRPVEIIVINDGSPDATELVVQPHVDAGSIVYLRQENAGQAAARNRGAAMARGEFLAFLDDDDAWLADALETLARAMDGDERVGLVFGDVMDLLDGFDAEVVADVPHARRRIEWTSIFAASPWSRPARR